MDSTIMRAMISDGNLTATLDRLDVDAREDYTVVDPNASNDNETLTLARIGRAVIMVQSNNRMMVHVHGHGPEQDDACWTAQVEFVSNAVAAFNAVALQVRDHPGVQAMIVAGFPVEMAAAFHGIDPPDMSGIGL